MGTRCTNQSLERLTFGDVSFNIVITSDVMEHVRVAEKAHKEIRRVLKPGGVYLFTVPHFRERYETEIFIEVVDPDDPSKDKIIREEYHGDANSPDGRTLAYRAYGAMIDDELKSLGLAVDYSKADYPDMGIMNTELFYCRSI
jgi:SAM-dependent methyltransferase